MKLRKLLLGLTTASLITSPLLVLTSCQENQPIFAAIEVVSEKDSVSIRQTLKMDINVYPTTITTKPEVNWSIDDDKIANIDKNTGLLSAFNIGEVTVTATLVSNPKVKASKKINVVDYMITPNITCSGGISASAESFALNSDLKIKYKFDANNIDINPNKIIVDGKTLDKNSFEVDENNQILSIKASVYSTRYEVSPTTSIELSTSSSAKIVPTVKPTTGLSDCTYNSVEGGGQVIINYNLESDYGIATANDVTAKITYSDGKILNQNASTIDKKAKTINVDIPSANDKILVTNVEVTINTCELWDKEEAIDYIYNRTFSVRAGNNFGTFWILNPYDSKSLSSYEYYIVTNWHVKYQLVCDGEDIEMGNGKDGSVSNYQKIHVIDWCDDKNMTYDGTPGNAVDLAVAHVDLSNAAGQDATIKTQLDNLNTYYEQHGYITQIADSTSSEKHFESLPLYTAGFPLPAEANPKWEEHSFNQNELEYCDWNVHSHGWEIGKTKFASDISPMYGLKEECPYYTMAGGSSGSMLMGNFGTNEHPYYKVVAIYYGAWSSHPGATDPKHISFSIFNNEVKNFLKDYI